MALGGIHGEWELGHRFGAAATGPRAARLGLLGGLEWVPSPRGAFALGVSGDLPGRNAPTRVVPVASVSCSALP